MISPTGVTSAAEPVRKTSSAWPSSFGMIARSTTLMPRCFASAMTVWRVMPFRKQSGVGVCNSRASPYPAHPAELVGNLAALDADQLRLDGGRYRAGRTVGDQYVSRSALDLADRSDDGGGAAGEWFLQSPVPGVRTPLIHRIAFLADRSAFLVRQGDDRVARDARQDCTGERRRHQRAVMHHEENVHAAEFLDPAMFGRIEEHDLIAAVLNGFGLRGQARRIIPAAFDGARAALGRAGVAVRHPHGHRLLAALEIGAHGAGDQDEQIFVGWADAEEGFRREHERPQIEAAVTFRDPRGIDRHQFVHRLQEYGFGQFRHAHAGGRSLEAACVLLWPEEGNRAVAEIISLQPLEYFLTVVQHGGGRIERNRRAGAHLRIMP